MLYFAVLVVLLFLQLTLLLLKLTLPDAADWPWWTVFSPMWGPLAITIVIGMLALLADGVVKVKRRFFGKNHAKPRK